MGVTLKDVAARAGVHPTVVSAVLNNRRYLRVSEERREYIRQVAKDMGYSPNIQAVSLRKKQKPTVGVFLPSWHDPLLLELIHGLSDGSKEYDIPLSYHFGMTADSYSDFINSMTSFQHTGIISYVPYFNSEFEKTLRKLDEYLNNGGKIISLNTLNWPMKKSVTLDMDDECGGWLAGRFLAERKFASYAVLSIKPTATVYTLRENKFKETCRQLDPGKEVLTHFVDYGAPSPENIGSAIDDMLGEAVFPLGMMCVCTDFASPILQACKDRDLVYGKDFELVSYDRSHLYEEFFPIPRVIQPFHQLGALAIKKLHRLLAGDKVSSEILKPILKYPPENK
ncbi:MAG: LacI family DNA-binding transcriptional regulator [Lentisphaeria bacterium]|nr:LacI family DNA-binding transcriptional regulator [Lentisphaeria bacterium]